MNRPWNRIRRLLFLSLLVPAGCSDDPATPQLEGDATPPSAVQDLATTVSAAGDSILLHWTAPGDDGSQGRAARYEIRYGSTPLSLIGWDTARMVDAPPAPSPAGEAESTVVTGLSIGTWFFGLRAADEVPNWSGISNSAMANVADHAAPTPVTDLRTSARGPRSVTLSWTSPGDNGGSAWATRYDLRYAKVWITAQNWDSATAVPNIPRPAAPGTGEWVEVSGLEAVTTYFFALRSADLEQNWSDLSNVVEATTASTWQLTFTTGDQGGAYEPSWSPDGSQIVFRANWEGHDQLYTIPRTGGTPVRLTEGTLNHFTPAWSPLGDKIAFVSDGGGRYRKIYVMDPTPGAPAELVYSAIEADVSECAWTPNGAEITFRTGWLAPTFDPQQILSVPVAGGVPELLVDGPAFVGQPAWSPDGSSLAFTGFRDLHWGVWAVEAAGGEWSPVAAGIGTAFVGDPTWSPDGVRIGYLADIRGNFEIFTVPLDFGVPEQLVFSGANEFSPAWSPDGTRIAFASDRTGASEIWLTQVE